MKQSLTLLLAIALVGLGSCEKREPDSVTAFFQNGPKTGTCPDYGIFLQSSVEPWRWDHVITVHSFVNDGEIAQMLTDLLNSSTNSNYKTVQLNH